MAGIRVSMEVGGDGVAVITISNSPVNALHPTSNLRGKLDPKAKKCIFIGYDERKKGWKCMEPETKKFVVSRDVVFDELSSYYSSQSTSTIEVMSHAQSEMVPQVSKNMQVPSSAPTSPISTSILKREQSPRGSHDNEDHQEEVQSLRRSQRNIVKPVRYRDGNLVSMVSCFFAGPIDELEPSSFSEAHGVKEWDDAMDKEMKALIKNETWDLDPKSEWVYKVKRNPNGSVARYKARLVARDFSQKYGVRKRDRLDICREQQLCKIRRRQVLVGLPRVGEQSRSAVLQLRDVHRRFREGHHESLEEDRDLLCRDFGALDRSTRGTIHHSCGRSSQ